MTGASRSDTSNIGLIWCTKYQSSLRLSRVPVVASTHYFRYGSNTCSHCDEEGQKVIRYMTNHFQDWRGAALFRYRFTVVMCEHVVFRVGSGAIRHSVNTA